MMKLTQCDYEKIADCFPKHRGTIKLSNLLALNAILYVLENGCKWRALPKEFGHWHTIYMRMYRWYKKGVLTTAFKKLQELHILNFRIEVVSLDSTYAKVHPDGCGALKKMAGKISENPEADGPPKFIWLPFLP